MKEKGRVACWWREELPHGVATRVLILRDHCLMLTFSKQPSVDVAARLGKRFQTSGLDRLPAKIGAARLRSKISEGQQSDTVEPRLSRNGNRHHRWAPAVSTACSHRLLWTQHQQVCHADCYTRVVWVGPAAMDGFVSMTNPGAAEFGGQSRPGTRVRLNRHGWSTSVEGRQERRLSWQ